MSRPTQGTAFFSIPVWQHAQPRRRSSASSSASSLSSSPSSSASHPSAPDDAQTTPDAPVARDESPPPASHSTDDDPFHRPRTLRRGRHVKLPRQLLANYQLIPTPDATGGALRSKHLGVMTTVLYRSLLTRDFARAERAFGCLIRSKNVDVRRYLWGIGVDLLLRRGKRGLKDAAEFLERLILFFPYRPHHHSNHPALGLKKGKKRTGLLKPRDSALEFQPALFSLLIEGSAWQDMPRRKEQRQKTEDAEDVGAGAGGEEEEDGEEITPEKIKERLEMLMLTPPWGDMPALLCLHGMVCLWVADVTEEKGEDDGELLTALREGARRYFEIAKKKGGTVPEGVADALQVEEEEHDENADMVDI